MQFTVVIAFLTAAVAVTASPMVGGLDSLLGELPAGLKARYTETKKKEHHAHAHKAAASTAAEACGTGNVYSCCTKPSAAGSGAIDPTLCNVVAVLGGCGSQQVAACCSSTQSGLISLGLTCSPIGL